MARFRSARLAFLLLASALARQSAAAENEHAGGFLERNVALGDWGGARSAMEDHGVAFGIHYTHEWLTLVRGGIRPGGEYNGLLELDLDLDLEKAFGWSGATIHASGYA